MKIDWRQELPQLAVIGSLFAVAAAVWRHVPQRMPVHWNLAGEVDRYGGKFEGVLLIPLIAAGLYGLLLFVPLLDSQRTNNLSFENAYRTLRISFTLFLAILYGLMLAVAFGVVIDFSWWLCCLMGILFAVIGGQLPALPPNGIAGVRTPWTVANPGSWDKTHQQARWVFLAIGLMFFPLGWFKNGWSLALLLTVAIGGLTWLVITSWRVWKAEQHSVTDG